MCQLEEKGMKIINHGFSRLPIQVNNRHKKYVQKNKYIGKHCAFHLPITCLSILLDMLLQAATSMGPYLHCSCCCRAPL